jgi:hypothetical protein
MRLALVVPMGLVLAGAILVTGCDGSDHDQAAVTPPPTPTTPAGDSFTAAVRLQTDTPTAMSDTSEPIEVARIVETSPENTEPEAVKF